MNDLSGFWSFWISAIVLGSIFGSAWLLYITRKSETTKTETDQTMGHAFDGIEEYDNPLPKWWLYMFAATIVFGIAYAVVYPTLGNYEGMLKWTSKNQWEKEVAAADEKYGPIFAKYASMSIEDIAKDEDALEIGQRLFSNNCAICHGSTGRGNVGFPNLTDKDWLYGGEPATIEQTLLNGRMANMPAKGLNPAMSESDVNDLVNYLMSFTNRSEDKASAERGQAMFAQACAACHGADAKGMQALGAPNLTDEVWLYGGSARAIKQTILHGRNGVMPAQEHTLGKEKVRILAGYVYSLSQDK